MTYTYDLTIGGVRFHAEISKESPNYESECRDYILLKVLATTINYRKNGSHSWLRNDSNAYDFAMEVFQSIRKLDCFFCDMEHFEKTMQSMVDKRINDYASASHSGKGKKFAAVGSGCENFCTLDSESEHKSHKSENVWRWDEVLLDESVMAPDVQAEVFDAAQLIRKHMRKLPELTQQCLELHAQGLINTEIAKQLGVDKSYVGKLIKQGTISLLAELGDVLR